jgi:hypothetical protein
MGKPVGQDKYVLFLSSSRIDRKYGGCMHNLPPISWKQMSFRTSASLKNGLFRSGFELGDLGITKPEFSISSTLNNLHSAFDRTGISLKHSFRTGEKLQTCSCNTYWSALFPHWLIKVLAQ